MIFGYLAWGPVQQVTGMEAETYAYAYDDAQRIAGITLPGSVKDTSRFDGESRVVRREVIRPGETLIDDTLTYNRQAKILTGAMNGTIAGLGTAVKPYTYRYYDAVTGRFSQVDPIGLAGGMNLYGFADGDPINFSDPFGLSRCKKDLSEDERKACEKKEKEEQQKKREAYFQRYNACIEDTPGSYTMAALSVVPLGNMKLGQGFRLPGSSPFTSIDRRFPWLPFANPEGGVAVRTVGGGAVKTAGTLGTIGAVVGTFATSYALTTIARCALEARNP